ncbi:Zn-dependent exopeptidase M28 [Clostridium sp. YIM B02505]|uniref:Zn-dependent exopeptidase M28 n=1 Tax=Clostridium yunnanense TaxID=2800325 RepID=A0ABS1EQ62_9CLOT|nr:M28 family metallopeptidase [Clostridium yunnanense]MBK1811408.1 Zn-dependent exopeptidase M28 [Clostridium yunnanense]
MARNLISLILTICILISNISFMYSNKLQYFDSNKVIENIRYLSSDTMEGRLPGTLGNKLAGEYIKNSFIKYNLSPLVNDYYDAFTAATPIKGDDAPFLRVYNKEKSLIKNYEYGVDFKDSFLNYRTNHVTVNPNDDFRIYPSAIEIVQDNKSFIFIVSTDNFNFRSSFISKSSSEMYIYISSKVYDDLLTYNKKGYTIDCFIPYKVEDITLNNVVGVIKGTNPKLPPLILSSHYDHLGKDLSGNIYGGALDNASGTSFMLELARTISSMFPPERDVIFVSFNAEELGLLGSKAFVDKNHDLLKNGNSINFDMIGGAKDIPMTIMTGENSNRSITSSSLQDYCKSNNIAFNTEARNASDHASFISAGIDSITICDSDLSKIHTPNDTSYFIDKSSIERDYKASWNQIIKYCYSNRYILEIYNKDFYIAGYFVSTILFLLLLIPKKNKGKFD